jgi:hypothetical protein
LIVPFPTSNHARVLVQVRTDAIDFDSKTLNIHFVSRRLNMDVIFELRKNDGDTLTCKVMFFYPRRTILLNTSTGFITIMNKLHLVGYQQ